MRVEKLDTPAQGGEKLGQIIVLAFWFTCYVFVIDGDHKTILFDSQII